MIAQPQTLTNSLEISKVVTRFDISLWIVFYTRLLSEYIHFLKTLFISYFFVFIIVFKASGGVYTWGHNGDGQLGTADHTEHPSPVLIMQLPQPAVAVAAGSSHSCVVSGK